MRKWKSYILMMTLVTVFIAGCSSENKQPPVNTGQQDANRVAVGVQLGQQAPDFKLLNEHDMPTSLSQFLGKVTVVNFWATWCGPCRDEMPDLQRFHAESNENTVLLGVNMREDKDTVVQFMQQGGYTYPVVRDAFGQVADQYQVRVIPTTFIIDQQGIIRYKKVGPVTAVELKRLIDSL